MADAAVAGLAVSGSFDCASQGRDAPLRMRIRRGRATTADGVRADCLRRMRLASEPTANVTAAPISTYQVHATFGITPFPGKRHNAIFTANPITMPTIAPA